MQKKVKLAIVIALVAVMTASVAYAWLASNVLQFSTTLAGSPFTLTILDNFNTRNILSPPYLPPTIYYEQPILLYTNTKNNAPSPYSNVTTHYEIWRSGGLVMDTSWVTVVVGDINTNTITTLTFSLYSDASISATANNALVATIGPYTAPASFSADANVTVTFHNVAPLTTFAANVWVAVN
ncbi:MAG: hypothetical protein ABSB89_05105 [Candidatus Bathyarchaeia archaeon]|jgi:hypothetical protein